MRASDSAVATGKADAQGLGAYDRQTARSTNTSVAPRTRRTRGPERTISSMPTVSADARPARVPSAQMRPAEVRSAEVPSAEVPSAQVLCA